MNCQKRTISYSEAVAFLDCERKWDLIYNKKIKKSTIHTEFGSMAHKVLETREIPEEHLYPNLKLAFNITSWKNYFENIFKEIDKLLADYDIIDRELKLEFEGIKGVIDLVCKHKKLNSYLLIDYKFTSTPKEYLDVYLDGQLKIYSYLFSKYAWVNMDQIQVGYLSIPKIEIQPPLVLKNGTLSKNKSQYTTKDLYIAEINNRGLNIEDYADILDSLPEYIKKITTIVSSEQIDKTITILKHISKRRENLCVLENVSAAKCKSCEYLKECKYD